MIDEPEFLAHRMEDGAGVALHRRRVQGRSQDRPQILHLRQLGKVPLTREAQWPNEALERVCGRYQENPGPILGWAPDMHVRRYGEAVASSSGSCSNRTARISNSRGPFGLWMMAVSPTDFPISPCATGEVMAIFPFFRSASSSPTIR